MITAIRHTGLVVTDLDRALRFWCDTLGFSVVKKMDESGPHIDAMLGLEGTTLTTAKIAAPDGNLIELLRFHSHPDKPTWTGMVNATGLTHVALTVDNLDVTCAKLATEGVTFRSSPQYSPDGYAKVVFAIGPEGVLLELVEVLNA